MRVVSSAHFHHQPVFRLPSPIQWTIGAHEPGDGDGSTLHGLPEPVQLVPTAFVGGICPQHPDQLRHWPLPLPGITSRPCRGRCPLCPPRSSSTAATEPGPRRPRTRSARRCGSLLTTVLCLTERYSTSANRHCTQAPTHQVSQKVWLSTHKLPLKETGSLAHWPFPHPEDGEYTYWLLGSLWSSIGCTLTSPLGPLQALGMYTLPLPLPALPPDTPDKEEASSDS